MDMLEDFLQTNYDHFPYVVFIQADGKGGYLHGHIVLSNVNSIDYRAVEGTKRNHNIFVMPKVEECMKAHGVQLDYSMAEELCTQKEQRVRKEAAEHELSGKDDGYKPEYVWLTDLKSRIRSAMGQAKSLDDYVRILSENGVTCEVNTSKKKAKMLGQPDGSKAEYLWYRLDDKSGFDDFEHYSHKTDKKTGKLETAPAKMVARGYTLGTDFDLETLMLAVQANLEREKKEEIEAKAAADLSQKKAAAAERAKAAAF